VIEHAHEACSDAPALSSSLLGVRNERPLRRVLRWANDLRRDCLARG
jgi:hypothetical protein